MRRPKIGEETLLSIRETAISIFDNIEKQDPQDFVNNAEMWFANINQLIDEADRNMIVNLEDMRSSKTWPETFEFEKPEELKKKFKQVASHVRRFAENIYNENPTKRYGPSTGGWVQAKLDPILK